ncbi:unnamed protein product [Cuscuta europaea]|uniref:Uncharacterized protein n=1 Tax=Cuscuta europaea TaxID=41803 RepID=A0A9P0ZE00_CUSEU|nr:unnamed protein product [Cuscuta europaea]
MNWAVARQNGKSAAGFLLRDHSGAMVAAEGFPLSGSPEGDEEVCLKAICWSQAFGFPDLEMDISDLHKVELDILKLDGWNLCVISAKSNKAAMVVAQLGLMESFTWRMGMQIPTKLLGAITMDLRIGPYID